MKKVLFATTATAALALGGMASAQGISLFGDARLGLGYNIRNDGTADLEAKSTSGGVTTIDGTDDLRAVSRVRFGVNMTGETNSGITFGATIRADNAQGGQGGTLGQTAGNVFVSGSFGTLTLGDTNGADEQWVGDTPGNLSLTGLGDLNETFFISNGGSFGDDVSNDFAANPDARPTIRYDFEIAGFGLSLSSNKTLSDVGVGAGYAGDFSGGTFQIGLGYYDYESFDTVGPATTTTTVINGVTVLVPVAAVTSSTPGGNQYSASIGGTFGDFGGGVVYTNADSDGDSFTTVSVGGTYGFGDFTVGAYWVGITSADGDLSGFDGKNAYGLSGAYDLGGGAQVAGGIQQNFGRDAEGGPTKVDSVTVADFGIKMSF